MGDDKLAVIVPFVNEWPQVIWTIRSIENDLGDIAENNFEVIAVDNYCEEVRLQQKEQGIKAPQEDKAHDTLLAASKINPWLKVIRYDEKLSHWNAKRAAIASTDANILCFIDAHCFVGYSALIDMFIRYSAFCREYGYEAATFHLPLTYQILEKRKLIYSLKCDLNIGQLGYRFSSYRVPTDKPKTSVHKKYNAFEVPCMSTCGMMISRDLYEYVGGWPSELGIYGGGESFMNFVLAILGKKKYVVEGSPLYHHGDRRGYHWNYTDKLRNEAIAAYMVGGRKLLETYLNNAKGKEGIKYWLCKDIQNKCFKQRSMIYSKLEISIEDWLNQWKD